MNGGFFDIVVVAIFRIFRAFRFGFFFFWMFMFVGDLMLKCVLNCGC